METKYFKRILLKIGKRLAWLISWFLSPITILRWTGILPFRAISFLEFEPFHFHDQAVLNQSQAFSFQGDDLLTPPPITNVLISHIVEVNRGMATQGGYVFDENGRLITEASHKYREQHQRALVSRPHSFSPTIKNFNCEVAILTASNHQIYWHWLFEVLPRVGMLEKTGKQPEKFYLQTSHDFQRESLGLLESVPQEAIIDCDQVPIISASKLVIPCHQIMGNYPQWTCQFLRDRFLPHAVKNSGKERNRIYISRENAQHRQVTNESEIIELLKRYGIIPVRLEELSFTEQVNIFHHAELVVGPHGGGLANLVFCTKGTKIIELFPVTTIDAFFALSQTLELNYYFLRARNGNPRNFGHDNYHIVLEDLLKTLEFAEVSSK